MADAADSPRQRLQNQYDLIERHAERDYLGERDAELLLAFGEAIDGKQPSPIYETEDGKQSFTASTVRQYLLRLRVDVCKNGHSLADISAEEFNQLMTALDDDRARSTTTQTQSAAKHLYRYHHDLGVDPDDVVVFEEDSSQRAVDPDQLLTAEEIEALRRKIDGSVNPIRNRALLELMIYTGQRARALQTLRIKDVEAHEEPGYIYLNDEVEGLKGALERGRRRPLLAARKHVRKWLDRHPRRDDPEAWLFIGQPTNSNVDLDKPWHSSSMRGVLRRAAERADIDPARVHPHAFRHYWYTSMLLQEGADKDDLKAVGGWSETSTAPDEIYRHITDEEHVKRLERMLGYRSEDPGRPAFIPETCDTCGEHIKSHWERCPNCDTPFTVRALRAQEQLDEDLKGGYKQMNPDDEETEAELAMIEAALDDPEMKAQVMELIAEKLSEE